MLLPETGKVRWLYIDFNAYFASVEQQLRSELRGKPVAIIPVDAPTTCCIACSYEAKAVGIRTGMDLAEARRRCADLCVVVGRQHVYAEYHHRFLRVLKQRISIMHVRSIDEVACRLEDDCQTPTQAKDLAQRIKQDLARALGPYLRCSIGVAPNELLAKLAAEIEKPDGLSIIDSNNLETRLDQFELRDVPGIGNRMELRLRRQGIHSVRAFIDLGPKRARGVWRSLEGERLWYRLRGYDFDLPATAPFSVGHEHVLPPAMRTKEKAGTVAKLLLARAAGRLRAQEMWARGLSVYLSFSRGREKTIWECHARMAETQDDLPLLDLLRQMWVACPEGSPTFVGVNLYDLIPNAHHTEWLFEEARTRGDLFQTLEHALGSDAKKIYPASLYEVRDQVPKQIAFASIPEF